MVVLGLVGQRKLKFLEQKSMEGKKHHEGVQGQLTRVFGVRGCASIFSVCKPRIMFDQSVRESVCELVTESVRQ